MSATTEKKLAVLMFTDVVDSVGLQKRIGSRAFAEQIRQHDTLFQRVIDLTDGGQVLQHTGDGFMLSFSTASEAVEAALRLQMLFSRETWPAEAMKLRIGLHLGEVLQMREQNTDEARPVGMATNLAARIMGLAEPGQILMLRAVYDDARHFVRDHPEVPGIDETFASPRWLSHGSYDIKGHDEPVEVFEVGLEGLAPLSPPESGEKAHRAGAAAPGSPPEASETSETNPEALASSDVVIAYSNLDDRPVKRSQTGWVSQLHENLQVRVAQLSGKQVDVVKLPDASAGGPGAHAVLKHVPQAKTIVSVLSPPFVQSDSCQKVVETYWTERQQSGDFEVEQHSRLLNVVKTPVEEQEIPPSLRSLYTNLSPYEFFERDPVTGRLREFDETFGDAALQRFHERVYDVAYDVSQILKHLGEPPPGSGQRTKHPKTIFLAATTSDLESERDRLRRELTELGHHVIPRQPLPLVAHELTTVVERCLEQADIAIHMVGQHFGLVPEATELSVVALQNEVAARFCNQAPLRRLIWFRRGLEPDDQRQAAFLQKLQSDPESVTGAELIADTLENLKVLMLSRWEREQAQLEAAAATEAVSENAASENAGGASVRRLYLIADARDEEALEPLEDFFYEQGIEVSLPAFDVDEAETQQIHIQNLRDCDAVLIYYGAASMHWVDFKIRDLQKAVGYREGKPIPQASVYLAPPPHRRKDRFKSNLVGVLRQTGEAFEPDVLRPFVESLKEGETS